MHDIYFRFASVQECLGILAASCASCNCMTSFYCAPLQVYTPFRSAQNHCPPDNVRPAGGYISWGIDSLLIYGSVYHIFYQIIYLDLIYIFLLYSPLIYHIFQSSFSHSFLVLSN
ncbi:hypothetical protein DWX78_14075 [Dorea formicigenerans]|uniref:Uncharacterized protein n=1 Tax=Dorea formicigenerans TaxID=39486 RepID=A0A412KFY0_9FIRM|nr:hypothetical protein DWX78_14075 [Dorea formicigenerans]